MAALVFCCPATTALLVTTVSAGKTVPPLYCRLPPKSPASNANKLKQPVNSEIILSDVPILPSSHAPRSSSGTLSEAPTNPNGSLYDKLGGPEALEAAVDLFYEKVLADERLKGFFEGTNMMRLVIKQVQQPLCKQKGEKITPLGVVTGASRPRGIPGLSCAKSF